MVIPAKKFSVSCALRTNSFWCNIASFPSGPQEPVYPPVSKPAGLLRSILLTLLSKPSTLL
jgi:hypothetical protein